MSLTRADLENDRMRKLFCDANPDTRVLSGAELDASINALLDQHESGTDVWLFGYGSLIWNPIIHFDERRVAKLHGFHRRFCLWSHAGRGSPQKPGLVLGLDVGGSCHGVAFRVAGHHAIDELRLLWRREMVVDSYCPRWVNIEAGNDTLRALAFIVNRKNANYAGKLTLETVVKTMVSARGHLGTPAEYLLETVHGLIEHGVRDPYLLELRKRVLAVHPELAASHAH